MKTIGLIIGGTGVGLLIGALIQEATFGGTTDDYEAAAAAGDEALYNSLNDDISSAKTISILLYSIGAVATITGAILFLTSSPGEPADLPECEGMCWDWGIGTPRADVGAWVGGQF